MTIVNSWHSYKVLNTCVLTEVYILLSERIEPENVLQEITRTAINAYSEEF